ncbi:DUF4136 domain-containing protein [Flavobacterium sp.]|uniref:DUF4136 domain-containing protein n=1 Tax=Flavobacterium sp. TaxID=239 RepID=UPI0026334825|nr:DUF4136 domain-containing protein [Flavobacterium sp.]MDD3005306.1 DUF4136 domain-containing protein [Flavobacterium sp.]
MKIFKPLSLLFFMIITACSSVSVHNDYDKNVDFSSYKTFAFYKNGIDKVEISDLDKKRILKAIENQLTAKGFTKSENPDVLVNLFTKSREQVDVTTFNNGWGYGWGYGWNPYLWGGNRTSVRTSTTGTLFIDLIDAKKKELVWQGEGVGEIFKNQKDKEKRIQEFVTEILKQYPPEKK